MGEKHRHPCMNSRRASPELFVGPVLLPLKFGGHLQEEFQGQKAHHRCLFFGSEPCSSRCPGKLERRGSSGGGGGALQPPSPDGRPRPECSSSLGRWAEEALRGARGVRGRLLQAWLSPSASSPRSHRRPITGRLTLQSFLLIHGRSYVLRIQFPENVTPGDGRCEASRDLSSPEHCWAR